jgi:hypothetical protein
MSMNCTSTSRLYFYAVIFHTSKTRKLRKRKVFIPGEFKLKRTRD